MSDFAATWEISRKRFDDSVADLNQAQFNWRANDEAMTIGEMALHLAGVEVSFVSQLKGQDLEGELGRLKRASVDGLMNDNPFPFSPDEITPEKVQWALSEARNYAAEAIANPDPYRERQIKSALGPIIDGTGAFARMAFHPSYHHGQVHLIRNTKGFPV